MTARAGGSCVRVVLPVHLRNLARVGDEVSVELPGGAVTLCAVLDALEASYPMLRGTIRDQASGERRPYLRFFACERDLSHDDPAAHLPAAIADGREPFLVIGAMAGG